jgi:hypothetical protein
VGDRLTRPKITSGGDVASMSGSVSFEKISATESWRVFDAAARRCLGLGADELVRRWDAGDYVDSDSVELMQVIMLRPSGG